MKSDILDYHEKALVEKKIPEWLNMVCPFCKKPLLRRSIRTVGVKFNTRNMGDLIVEFCCFECSKMDTLYYRKQIKELSDLSKYLSGELVPEITPVLEEEMYKMGYNNLVEQMVMDKTGDKI